MGFSNPCSGRARRRGHKLGRRTAPRSQTGGFRILLHKRHRDLHRGLTKVLPKNLIHRHRRASRGWSGGSFLQYQPSHDSIVPSVWRRLLPWIWQDRFHRGGARPFSCFKCPFEAGHNRRYVPAHV